MLAVGWVIGRVEVQKDARPLGDAAFVLLSHVEFAEGPGNAQALVSGHSPAGRSSAG